MKSHLLPSLAIAVVLLGAASPGWTQSPDANKAQNAQKSVKPVVLKAAPADPKAAAVRAEQDRQAKAAQVNSSVQKKNDETAKSVTGNIK